MAVYGVSIYGTTTYGSQAFSTLIADAFVAVPKGYGSLLLSWNPPGGDWTKVRLVRSSFGFPSTIEEGTILFTDDELGARLTYLDEDLREGRFYYYSLFVLLDPEAVWHRAASTFELIPENHGLGQRMYDLLPQVHRSDDAANAYQLQRFLGLFGYQLDRLRTEARTLLDVANIDYVSGGLLPVLAASLNVTPEPELGMITTRRILKNSVYLSKIRGTKPGIEGTASVYTGWGATTVIGKNLAFDYNDSGFKESIGHWQVISDALLDRVLTPAPTVGTGVLRIKCTSPSAAAATVGLGSHINGTFLLPATAGLAYSASCLVRSAVTARTRRLVIVWLDASKTVISATAYGSATDSTGAWTALSISGTAPAGTKWMAVIHDVQGPATDEYHYLAAFQIEQAAAPTAWESGREIILYFDPDRENLVKNPSFETNTTGWAARTSCTIARSNTKAYKGTWSLAITATASTTVQVDNSASLVDVAEGDYLTASAYFSAGTTPRSVRLYIVWLDAGSSVLSAVTGALVVDATASWVRPTVEGTAPENAAKAYIIPEVVAAANGEVHYLDAVLIEKGIAVIGDYFDGTTASTDDHLWSGTVHASTSRYYSRRSMKVTRLNDVMPDHIPLGVTFRAEFTPVP